MALCTANMRSCDPKNRCQIGPNKGQAYSVKNPCCGQGVFNKDLCDCVIPFPEGAVQYRITEGNIIDGEENRNCIPLDWKDLLPAPYVDADGRLRQFDFTITGVYGCETPSIEYKDCTGVANGYGSFPTSLTATKIAECSGGSTVLFAGYNTNYFDGVEADSGANLSLQFHTYCVDDGRRLLCSDDYPLGTVWTAEVEYRVSNGEGGWDPL